MRERIPLLIGLIVLALALLLGSVSIARGIRDRGRSDVITVTGSAKKEIVSNFVIWDGAVTSQRGYGRGGREGARGVDDADPVVPALERRAGRRADGAADLDRDDHGQRLGRRFGPDRRVPADAQLRGPLAAGGRHRRGRRPQLVADRARDPVRRAAPAVRLHQARRHPAGASGGRDDRRPEPRQGARGDNRRQARLAPRRQRRGCSRSPRRTPSRSATTASTTPRRSRRRSRPWST